MKKTAGKFFISRCEIVVLLLWMDEELNPVYGVVLQSEVLFRTKRSNAKSKQETSGCFVI